MTNLNFFELIEIKKLFSMIIALGAIQLIGGLASRRIGARAGFILSGFINGLISSTAFTATLSKKSRSLSLEQVHVESISFLSATLAMLVQGFFLMLIGTDFNLSISLIFITAIVTTTILIFIRNQKNQTIKTNFPKAPLFDFLSLLKLTIFIIGIITISKLLQIQFGGRGIEILTFLVSLFEIHGSIIANAQMLAKNTISIDEFSFLLSLSLSASYLGKIFIVLFLGHPFLKKRVILWSSLVVTSLFIAFAVIRFVV